MRVLRLVGSPEARPPLFIVERPCSVLRVLRLVDPLKFLLLNPHPLEAQRGRDAGATRSGTCLQCYVPGGGGGSPAQKRCLEVRPPHLEPIWVLWESTEIQPLRNGPIFARAGIGPFAKGSGTPTWEVSFSAFGKRAHFRFPVFRGRKK